MVRSDDDTWDITDGVGATALGMAMSRAFESSNADPLITDPYAQCFLDAATERGWRQPYTHATTDTVAGVDPDLALWIRTMEHYAACRTKFFDDFFIDAAECGLRQVVILAAGLDTRAWRLPWASDTIVYEIDQPKVLEFKATTLRSNDAAPAARYLAVPVDLRLNWPKSLRDIGFDPNIATAWLTEGLLPYLPAAAQDLLFERIHMLSAPASWIAADVYPPEFYQQETVQRERAHTRRIAATFQEIDAGSGPAEMLDDEQLSFIEERTVVSDWLNRHGWSTTSVSALDTMASYQRPVPAGVDTVAMSCDFVVARRSRRVRQNRQGRENK